MIDHVESSTIRTAGYPPTPTFASLRRRYLPPSSLRSQGGLT
jgi:hypothetical protein